MALTPPYSLMLPATIPEKARRRLAARHAPADRAITQRAHRSMSDLEWPLEFQRDFQQQLNPYESLACARIVANLRHALHHGTRHAAGIIDDHLVAPLRGASNVAPMNR